MISKMNFESEWCRCGADMKKNRTALRDVLFIRELLICEVCGNFLVRVVQMWR